MKIHDLMKNIDSKKKEIVRLVQNLIQIKNVNPPGSTSEIAGYIKEYISERGLKCELYEQEKTKVNAVGTLSGSGDKKFIWNGHLDVVPISKPDGWSVDPWEGKVVNSKILGRGAADMKGSIAAVISAACTLADSDVELSGDWILGFTADEETGGEMGAEYLVKNGILSGDACIVGEPTSLSKLGVGEKGVIWLKVKAEGNKKFWLEFKEGKVDFGEGEGENPTLTFTTTMNVFTGILFGHIEISSAHKAGDISFEGSGEELMDFQAITSVINDFLQYLE